MNRILITLLLLLLSFVNVSVAEAQFIIAVTNVPTSSSSGFQTETDTYLAAEAAAGKTYTSQQELDIDTVFRDLKGLTNPRYTTYNVLSKVTIIYPFFSGVSASDKVNMVNPGTYNYTETGSPTYSTSTYSVAFNGTSQYLNTTHTPNGAFGGGSFAASDFTMFAYHRIDNNTDASATIGETGGGNSYMQILNTAFVVQVICGKGASSEATAQNSSRLWWCGWGGSGTTNAYYNGTNIQSNSITYDNTPNRSIYIGAFNNGGTAAYGGATTVDFYIEGFSSWSDAEEAFMYNCFKRAKLSINGQTWN